MHGNVVAFHEIYGVEFVVVTVYVPHSDKSLGHVEYVLFVDADLEIRADKY
jgi:hypothetical protein